MSIRTKIAEDLKRAMKAGEKEKVGVLRMLRARILEAEVAQREKKGRDFELDDEDALSVLASYAKQRRESIDSYENAGRTDLADRERAELAVVQTYLPAQLSEDRIREIVREAIAEAGADSPAKLGAVMKIAMPRLKGAADGKLVNRLAREMLTPDPGA